MPLVKKYSIINFIIPSERYVAPLLDHTVGLKGGGKKRRGEEGEGLDGSREEAFPS